MSMSNGNKMRAARFVVCGPPVDDRPNVPKERIHIDVVENNCFIYRTEGQAGKDVVVKTFPNRLEAMHFALARVVDYMGKYYAIPVRGEEITSSSESYSIGSEMVHAPNSAIVGKEHTLSIDVKEEEEEE